MCTTKSSTKSASLFALKQEEPQIQQQTLLFL